MQTVKAFVIFMGLLIAAGLGLLGYALIDRLAGEAGGGRDFGEAGSGRGFGEAGGGRGFGEVALSLPAGCVIAAAQASDGRLVLRTDGPLERGCQQVVVIDPDSGRVVGRIRAAPEP